MASENARAVAKQVLENIGSGKKVSLRKIIKDKGYAQNTADNPKLVTETKTYQETVRPVVDALEKERKAIIARLPKVRAKAKYRDLIDGLDKVTKNIQLLTGGKTEDFGLDQLTEDLKNLIAGTNRAKEDER